jgi:Domain of unknown function (DUF4386)
MIRAGRVFAWIFSVAFFVASVWYFLLSQQLSVADEPTFARDVPFDQMLEGFYDWYVTTLIQERLNIVVNFVGFLALIGVALALREVFGRERPVGILAAAAATLGSVLWIVGNVVQIGGHRAVEVMARGGNDLDPVNAISFTIDRIDDWFELIGFALIGFGAFAFGVGAIRTSILPKAWGYYTLALGALLVVVSIAYAFDNGDLVDLLLLIVGVLLAPAWGLWVASLLSPARPRPASAGIT